jgi:rare lipoprotein A
MNKLLSFSLTAIFAFISFTGFTQTEELGLASYYGDKFHGRKTAYGDTYDRNKYTCAHKRHKYGTELRVTRIDNKKSVVVKVTDRGPFVKGRVVDLSYVAAEKIGLIQDGVAEVKVEVVGKESSKKPDTASVEKDKSEKVVTETVRPQDYDIQPRSTTTEKPADTAKRSSEKDDDKAAEKAPAKPQADNGPQPKGVYKLSTAGSEPQYAVQVASMNNHANALKQVDMLKAKWFKDIILLAEPKGETVSYKVLMGPFDNEDSAKKYKASLKKKHKMDGFVVTLPVERPKTTVKGGEPTEYSMNESQPGVILAAPKEGDYGVQVASLDNFDSAVKYVEGLKARWFKDILVKVDDESYKVILGPMEEEASATNYMKNLEKKHKIKGFVVNLKE